MTAAKRRRLVLLATGVGCLALAAALALNSLQSTLVFFRSPSEIAAQPPPPEQRLRVGGLVETGSVEKLADGVTTAFRITDLKSSVAVRYRGMLPALFREGQGVVAEGSRDGDGTLVASQVLAKHDETYMPKEVVDSLKASGRWKEGEALPPHPQAMATPAAAIR